MPSRYVLVSHKLCTLFSFMPHEVRWCHFLFYFVVTRSSLPAHLCSQCSVSLLCSSPAWFPRYTCLTSASSALCVSPPAPPPVVSLVCIKACVVPCLFVGSSVFLLVSVRRLLRLLLLDLLPVGFLVCPQVLVSFPVSVACQFIVHTFGFWDFGLQLIKGAICTVADTPHIDFPVPESWWAECKLLTWVEYL